LQDFYETQNNVRDSLLKSYSLLADSLANAAYDSTMKYYKDQYYKNPNSFIDVGPVPTSGQLEINGSHETLEQISILSLINSRGDEYSMPIGKNIKIDGFPPGVYQLKFGLQNGTFIIKKIVKL
jgi:hypothetical protein